MFIYREIVENLTNAGLPLMKASSEKKARNKAELTKHGLMFTTFVFFFGFTKLGFINKLFFAGSKCFIPMTYIPVIQSLPKQ